MKVEDIKKLLLKAEREKSFAQLCDVMELMLKKMAEIESTAKRAENWAMPNELRD